MALSLEILERMKALAKGGATVSELSDVFDASETAIRGRLRKMGIKTVRKVHTVPDAEFLSRRNQIICEAYQAGQTLETVGIAHGLTRERVRQILEICGVNRRHERSTKPKRVLLTEEQKRLRRRARFWTKMDITATPDECWVWMHKYTTNYPRFGYLTDEGVHKSDYAHRVAYTFTYGEPQNWVLHRCNNASCCNPSHLYDGTPKENARDRDLAGNGPADNPNYKRRLNADDIPIIESMLKMGIVQRKIAEHFDTSMNIINKVSRQMKNNQETL